MEFHSVETISNMYTVYSQCCDCERAAKTAAVLSTQGLPPTNGTVQRDSCLNNGEEKNFNPPPLNFSIESILYGPSRPGPSPLRMIPARHRSSSRPVFSHFQRQALEQHFQREHYLSRFSRHHLASDLGLTENQVKVWFQNRRVKWKQEGQGQRGWEKLNKNGRSPQDRKARPTQTRLETHKGIEGLHGSHVGWQEQRK